MADPVKSILMYAADLNKVYRAVHDGVCPKCGGDMIVCKENEKHKCGACDFYVTFEEMNVMQATVGAWCAAVIRNFEAWRESRK